MYKFNNSEVDLSIPFPRKMLVWDDVEENARERVVIAITSVASHSYKVLVLEDPEAVVYEAFDEIAEYKNAKEISPVTSKANIVNIKGYAIDMSEPFPRWMMVSNSADIWKKRKVLYVNPDPKSKYVAIAITANEETYDNYRSVLWNNVKELPKPKELTLKELVSTASKHYDKEVVVKYDHNEDC